MIADSPAKRTVFWCQPRRALPQARPPHGRLRPRKAALDGVASLTPRQAQVCGLAAGGKSNREIAHELFLSVKTVETHLAASYEKLGVTGRGEMVSALAASP